jgi:hypothetical protein
MSADFLRPPANLFRPLHHHDGIAYRHHPLAADPSVDACFARMLDWRDPTGSAESEGASDIAAGLGKRGDLDLDLADGHDHTRLE